MEESGQPAVEPAPAGLQMPTFQADAADANAPSAGSSAPSGSRAPLRHGATFGSGLGVSATAPRQARVQRDFALLRQEIESKNKSIRREIKAVNSQLDRLKEPDDETPAGEEAPAIEAPDSNGPLAPKDPATLLVLELQTKLEEQQAELEDAMCASRTAALGLEDVKAEQQAELEELRTVRSQLVDRATESQDNASHRVLELQTTVEEQTMELERVQSQLTDRVTELEKLKDELSSCSSTLALKDDDSQRELTELRVSIEEQRQEIFGLKAQLVATDGLKAQLLTRNAELQDKANDLVPELQQNLEEQGREMVVLKDELFNKVSELKKLQELSSRHELTAAQAPSPSLLKDLQSTIEAQRAELAAVRLHLNESEARVAACSLELTQNDQAKVEELVGNLEDLRVELATTKAQLVTRNLELTKMEAQLVARNLELTKYEEQRAELACVKAQLMARDLKLMKQEVAMALTDAKSPSAAASSTEAANDKEASLKARVSQLEAEASTHVENVRKLEEELRRRDDLLCRTPRKQLEAFSSEAGEPLAEQLSFLAADVLSRNDQLAEKQLSRARAFLEVLRGAAWAREATPSSFKLGKFLDDLAICLQLEAKKALGQPGASPNKVANGRKGSTATPGKDAGRSSSTLSSPAALPAPPVPAGLDAQGEESTVKLPASYRRPALRSFVSSPDSPTARSTAPGSKVVGPPPPTSPGFSSSYPRASPQSTLERMLDSKLLDRIPPRVSPNEAPLPTASSLGMSASSLNSTQAASVYSSNSVIASPTIYSAPDRQDMPARGLQRGQEV